MAKSDTKGPIIKKEGAEYSDIYIHWYLNDRRRLGQKYSAIANSFIKNLNSQKLIKAYSKTVKNAFDIPNQEILNEVIGFKNNATTQKFQEAINTAFQLVDTQTAKDFGLTKKGDNWVKADGKSALQINQNQITKISKEMLQFFDMLETSMRHIEMVFSSEEKDITAYYQFLTQKLQVVNPNMAKDLQTNRGKYSAVLTRKRIESLNSRHQNMYNNLMEISQQAKKMKGGLKSYINTTLADPNNTKTFKEIMNTIVTSITFLRGLVLESLEIDILSIENIRSMIDEQVMSGLKYSPNGIIKNIISSGGNQSRSSMAFSQSTSDGTIFIDYLNKKGQVVVSVPAGMSIKKSASSTNNYIDVAIKSSSFGKLMRLTRTAGIINKRQEEAIYNILANHGKTKTGDISDDTFVYSRMTPLLNAIHDSFLVAGLAGSLTKEDLTTIVVINNKVYSVLELLANSGAGSNGQSSVKNMKMKLVDDTTTQQKWAASRHKFIYDADNPYSLSRKAALQRSNLWNGPGGILDSWRVQLHYRGKV